MSAPNGPFNFVIGEGLWEQQIRYFTAELDQAFWCGFHPVSSTDIARIEAETCRKLPDDFKMFLRVFGCGGFPLKYGGDISSPDEIIFGCHCHLWTVLGSAGWAKPEEQQRFYISRGAYNPNSTKYTANAMVFDDVNLLDLLQIGSNGMGCYHQLYVGARRNTFGYGLLTPEITVEDASPSFSEGLRWILTHHWNFDVGEEEQPTSL